MKSYYSREVMTIFLLLLTITAVWASVRYRDAIAAGIFSEKGMMILLGLVIAGLLSVVIRIYYRVMVIRYHGKN